VNAYGELGVHFGKGVASHAIRDLELGVVLNSEDSSLDFAVAVGGRNSEGRGEEGEKDCGFEIHGGGRDVKRLNNRTRSENSTAVEEENK
jgi:hypothetical protein